jgi:oligosaccharyltransferase complex subunit beta
LLSSCDFYDSVFVLRKWVLLRFCFFSFLGIICNLGFFLGFGGALDLALATACGVDFNEAGVEFMMH